MLLYSAPKLAVPQSVPKDGLMMEEILKTLGPWAVVPAASMALAGYAISVLVGLHRTKSQQRIEFLNLWRGADQMDDMALEVAVRHLCGTYLPARIVRRICNSDHCADGVFEVAQLWPLFRYDAVSGTVGWAKPEYAIEKKLSAGKRWYAAAYFGLALTAFGFLAVAVGAGPTKLLAWVCGLNTLLFPVLAFASLAKSETFALAGKVGLQWLGKLNGGAGVARSSGESTPLTDLRSQ